MATEFNVRTEVDLDEGVVRSWYTCSNMTHFCVYGYFDEPNTLYFANLYVDEKHRRQGIGRKILDYVQKLAKASGANKIRLWAEKDSIAYNWYIRLGYEDTGQEYKGKPNNVWMEKPIEQE